MSAEGTPAGRFALEHAHYREDLDLWAELADASGGPVLDLGAAVGRVSLHLAARGHEVVAVDVDPDMVAELEAAAAASGLAPNVSAVCADLRTLDLGRQFPLILLPMNTLQVFLTAEDQLAVLRAVRRHLADGGEFAFDLILADLDALTGVVGTLQPTADHRTSDGRVLVHAARFESVDAATGTVRFTIVIDEDGPDGPARHERPHTVHLYDPSEVWTLIAEAGLAVHAVYGDFAGTPLEPASERQVFRCGVAA